MILRNIRGKTRLMTNSRRGINFIKHYNYEHFNINYSNNFVLPENKDINIQYIKNRSIYFKDF